jgi:Tfp pilus assembly protein PilO
MKSLLASATPTKVHLAGAVVATLMIVGSSYALYSSWEAQQSGIESSQLEITQVSSQLSDTQRERGRLVNQISNLEVVVQQHDSIEHITNMNELAVKLVALAESQGLELEQFEPGTESTTNGLPSQEIAIQVTASFVSIQTWLNQLHELMPDIHVEALSIRSNNSAPGMVSTNIRLNWYIPEDASAKP